MDYPKIIETSTHVKTDDPEVFFDWFESNFISGFDFGFGDRYFLMSTGRMIPLRKKNTLTISIRPHNFELIIKAIKSPHGGTDIKARGKINSQEFESLFRDVWDEITTKQSASIEEPVVDKAGSGISEKADNLQARWDKMSLKTKKNFREAWKTWNRMRKVYRQEKIDGQTKEAQPKIKDWQTKVAKDLHWDVSESRLRDVKEMGESKIIK